MGSSLYVISYPVSPLRYCVKLYGGRSDPSLGFILDGSFTLKALNARLQGDDSPVLFSAGDLTDRDHQLNVTFSPHGQGRVLADYLEYVAPLSQSVLRVLR